MVPILFDKGANISIISSKLVSFLNLSLSPMKISIKSFNALSDCSGLTTANVTIGSITENVQFHVVDSTSHPVILGLDSIREFRLRMDEDNKISQSLTLLDHEVSNETEKMPNQAELSINSVTSNTIENLLTEFSDIFSKHEYDIGEIKIEEAQINLESDIPISLTPYRCSEYDQKIIDEYKTASEA